MKLSRTLALLALLSLPLVTLAQEGGTPPAGPSSSAVTLSADLRAEYILGEPILVHLTVTNPTDSTQSFPDLSRRPHLVRFDLVYPDGKKQSWFTTPPEQDPGQKWSVSPHGQKRALLEIPSSGRLKAGNYTLTVRVITESGELSLAPHALRLAPASPSAGKVWYEPLGLERSGHQVVWLHKAASGYDLYVHHADGRDPSQVLGDYHLLHLDQAIDPVLTASRPQDRWSRWIYWQEADGTLSAVRLQAQSLQSTKPLRTRTPYPKIELLGRGSTDASGGLHIPFWVASPSGKGGELRVASVPERGEPRFRLVVRLAARPAWVETTVDGNGDLRLLLETENNADIYTLSSAGELPATGQRLYRYTAPEGDQAPQRPLLARFGYLPELGEEAGGLAVQLLLGSGQTLRGVWYSLNARELKQLDPLTLPEGARPIDLVPRGYEPYSLLYNNKDGEVWFGQPSSALLTLGRPLRPSLVLNGKGAVLLRTVEPGGPVKSRVVLPSP